MPVSFWETRRISSSHRSGGAWSSSQAKTPANQNPAAGDSSATRTRSESLPFRPVQSSVSTVSLGEERDQMDWAERNGFADLQQRIAVVALGTGIHCCGDDLAVAWQFEVREGLGALRLSGEQ